MIFAGLLIIIGAILFLADYVITHFGVYIIIGLILFVILDLVCLRWESPKRDENTENK